MAKKLTLIFLEVAFFSIIAAVTYLRGLVIPPVPMLILLVFATMRTAHTISYNEVCEWLREPFCYVAKDSCGAGSDVHARTNRGGFVEAIGGLLSCPSACASTWSALMLYSIWLLFPAFGTTLAVILGLAGGAEVLHYLTNFFEWSGRQARVLSGKISPDNE